MNYPARIVFLLIIMFFVSSGTLGAATLAQFGTAGDGITNDFNALKKAFNSGERVLDGEGKTYRVIGSLQIDRDITLQNIRLVQGEKELSPELLSENHPRFREKLFTRTLLIRSPDKKKKLNIRLENIYIDRGTDETQGLPSDSAAIWLDGVKGSLENIEITGNGSGMGIMIVNSSELKLAQVSIHDMFWKPWNSKPQLDYNKVSQNWNEVPYWQLSRNGTEQFKGLYFDWERIQERIAGIHIVQSKKIDLENITIESLMARFEDNRLIEYQTDGVTIGSNTDDIHINQLNASKVWEGIDLTGSPLANATVKNSRVEDAHAFGFKMANGARKVILENNIALRCGLSGFVISGKNNPEHTHPASGEIVIRNCVAKGTGVNGYWENIATIAGYRIMSSRIENPSHIRIESSKAITGVSNQNMAFGFHSEADGDKTITVQNVESRGHTREAVRGFEVVE